MVDKIGQGRRPCARRVTKAEMIRAVNKHRYCSMIAACRYLDTAVNCVTCSDEIRRAIIRLIKGRKP